MNLQSTPEVCGERKSVEKYAVGRIPHLLIHRIMGTARLETDGFPLGNILSCHIQCAAHQRFRLSKTHAGAEFSNLRRVHAADRITHASLLTDGLGSSEQFVEHGTKILRYRRSYLVRPGRKRDQYDVGSARTHELPDDRRADTGAAVDVEVIIEDGELFLHLTQGSSSSGSRSRT